MRRSRTSLPTATPIETRHGVSGVGGKARVRPTVVRWPKTCPTCVCFALIVVLVVGYAFFNRLSWDTMPKNGIYPRALSLWEDVGHRAPCIIDKPPDGTPTTWTPLNEADQRQPSKAGILFVKIDKAGSSTMAGVTLRIAHALGRRRAQERGLSIPQHQQICRARMSHAWSKQSDFSFGSRNRYKSFLFTMIRDPKSRAISEYNYQVGMAGIEPTEENFLSHLKSIRNFQLGLVVDPLEKDRVKEVSNTDRMSELVSQASEELDYIALLERLDESLVAMQFILGLETRDILYSSTKQSGKHILVMSRANNFNGECKRIPKVGIPRGVKNYFEENEWKLNNMGDYLLYEAASQELDRIINAIGRIQFEEKLAQFRRAQALADAKCTPTWPCTDEGRVRSSKEQVSECYLWDLGCNYHCLDELVLS